MTPELIQARRIIRDVAGDPTGECGEPEWFVVAGGMVYPLSVCLGVPGVPVEWVEVES